MSWLQERFTDWLYFLGGNCPPIISENDLPWARLFGLLGLMLVLTGVIIGIPIISLNNFTKEGLVLALLESKPAIYLIIVGAIMAVVYSFLFARIFKVPINTTQAFFSILFLGLPWLPLWAFVRNLVYIDIPFRVLIINAWFVIAIVVPTVNFCKCISAWVPACPKWRIRASAFAPFVIAIGIFILALWLKVISLSTDDQPTDNLP